MRALSVRKAATLRWGALLVCGCSAPTPDPLPLTVGVHEVQLIVPEGWQHLDHGREQRFEQELSQVSLADMGPATPDGFRREIVRARELYEVLAQIDALPEPSMETLALSVLETLGHDERYDIALQEAMTVEGRFALLSIPGIVSITPIADDT